MIKNAIMVLLVSASSSAISGNLQINGECPKFYEIKNENTDMYEIIDFCGDVHIEGHSGNGSLMSFAQDGIIHSILISNDTMMAIKDEFNIKRLSDK